VLRIENCNVEFLDRKILQTLPEDFVHVARTPNGNAFVALLTRHAPAELERGVDGNGASGAYAREARQGGDRLGRESPQGTVSARKNLVSNSNCGIVLGSAAEEYCEKLG
jgi:hypothetical protein